MAVNKVQFGNRVLMDISDSTLTAEDLLEGLVAYNRSGERIIGRMAKIILDDAMSDTSENGVKNRVIKAYIDGGAGAADMSSMFEIAMADEYHVSSQAEAPEIISNALNLDGFVTPIGTSGISWKKPTVVVPEITWSDTVDDNYDVTGTGTVRVLFGTAGAITKTVRFKMPGEGKIYAATLENKQAAIDTGILANYAYTFRAKGYATSSTSSLIGAFVSTSERTTIRLQPGSGQVQAMWPTNVQIAKATHGLDTTQEIEYTANASGVTLTQNSKTYTQNMSGTSSGNPNANIYLLNEVVGGAQGYGTLVFAEILDGNGDQVAYFAPYKLHSDEIVIINTSGLTPQQIYDIVEHGDSAAMASRILRPTSGTLVEVQHL